MSRIAALPRGTPTFLFTDIEGSTQLLERLGGRYADTLARHRRLLTEAIESHGGVVFGNEGDALFVAFDQARSAVAAAIAGQQALVEEPWSDDGPVRVRMGMHTGEVAVVDDDYVGMTVHIAARVAASGHGGQVLVTELTAQLAGGPPAIDLGRHRLKDVGEHRLLQLVAPGLPEEHPPLRTLSSLPNNLPAAVDEFVGRQTELAELVLAVESNRLVTLTGPGGSGKTRLALETGVALLPRFSDGVWLVDLAPVDDGSRVPSTVAEVLDVRQQGDQPIERSVQAWLHDRELLLLLDNCEHLVDAVGRFCTGFLGACPQLRVLATSRAYLGVRGEQAVQTPPLRTPGDDVEGTEALSCDAVELFITRAVAAAPNFDVTTTDVGAIARICRHLDGLPLAIELAAARLRALSVEQLAERLDDRFRLLRSSSPTDVPRHQTLRAVVAWSYDLLDDAEQHLFERLAVFPHHFDLEMAEAVTSGDPVDELDVVDVLTHLLEKSLITTVDAPGGMRYQLLETLRAFGLEQLTQRGQLETYRDRLLAWSIETVDELERVMRTPAMDDALRQATDDAITHRAAAQWAATSQHPTEALRIESVVPLTVHRAERRDAILDRLRAAEAAGPLEPSAVGHAWAAIGNNSFETGDWETSTMANGRAVAAFEQAGLPRQAAWSKYLQLHSLWGAGDLDAVDRMVVEVVAEFHELADDMGLGFARWIASQREPDLRAADEHAAQADALLRQVAIPTGIAHNIEGRGIIALEDGRLGDAARYVAEAVRIFADYENTGCSAHTLEAAALVLDAAGDPGGIAVDLLGAAERFRERSGQTHRPWEVRARSGPTTERVRQLDAAMAETGLPSEPQLSTVAAVAVRALHALERAPEPRS